MTVLVVGAADEPVAARDVQPAGQVGAVVPEVLVAVVDVLPDVGLQCPVEAVAREVRAEVDARTIGENEVRLFVVVVGEDVVVLRAIDR